MTETYSTLKVNENSKNFVNTSTYFYVIRNYAEILSAFEFCNRSAFMFPSGLKSRFDLINFEDFDEDELKTIWTEEIRKRHFDCDDRVTSVVAQRLAKSAGRKGFGNARAVRKEARSCSSFKRKWSANLEC
jgi:predicted nucleotidyltransferase